MEVFPLPGDRTVRWYLLDPRAQAVRAHVDLPSNVRLLGGDGRSVVVLTRHAFDVEIVQVYDSITATGGRKPRPEGGSGITSSASSESDT